MGLVIFIRDLLIIALFVLVIRIAYEEGAKRQKKRKSKK